MELIEYLTGLAPEGETFLIVKQKPQGGTHADGTPKCTWPAFMPTARQRRCTRQQRWPE
jgi:secreted PhoX family phosphatase